LHMKTGKLGIAILISTNLCDSDRTRQKYISCMA
jgi:hypothetical protein